MLKISCIVEMWHNYNYSYFYYEFHWWTAFSPWSFEDDIVWFILSFVLVFWWWYCVIYFIICALNCGKYRHMVQCFVHSSTAIRLHSGQNAVDSQIIAKWVYNKFPTTVTECNITANCGIKKKDFDVVLCFVH